MAIASLFGRISLQTRCAGPLRPLHIVLVPLSLFSPFSPMKLLGKQKANREIFKALPPPTPQPEHLPFHRTEWEAKMLSSVANWAAAGE